ncbi:MAG: hypothetical protein F4X13_02475 [Gammaproteobacteria bacterium]|nr:hypothetical protein [Gammaproteobacteria bacterium]
MKRMKLSQELIAILAVGVTLTGLQVTQFVSLRGELGDLRGEMGTMEAGLRGDMATMETRLRGGINLLREDVRHDIDALRIDIQDVREDVRQLRDKLLVPAGGT